MSNDTASTDARIIACTAAIKAIVETLNKKDPSFAAAVKTAFETNLTSLTPNQHELRSAAKTYGNKKFF